MFRVIDNTRLSNGEGVGCISIVGPNNESVCDFFPFAKHGIGKDLALQLAEIAAEAMANAVEQADEGGDADEH